MRTADTPMIIPVILSGGSGTRLWPLSTPEMPKQFLPLVSERSLFQETVARLEGLSGLLDPIVVCNESHGRLVADQLRQISAKASAVVLEPEGRNTAPAIGIAAHLAAKLAPGAGGPGDAVLLVLPADHVIADTEAFHKAVAQALNAAASGHLVTFGVVPTAPETGYGYIEQGAKEGDWYRVARFVEKPDPETAERYLAAGRFLWNSGMFVFAASAFLAELARCAPAIHSATALAAEGTLPGDRMFRLGDAFLACPSNSVDYAVMEKTDRAAVVPLAAGWSDVGSWAALYDVLAKDDNGNAVRGDVVAMDARNNLVIPGSRKIALLGVEDVVVVDAGDRLLILRRNRSQHVRELQKLAELPPGNS